MGGEERWLSLGRISVALGDVRSLLFLLVVSSFFELLLPQASKVLGCESCKGRESSGALPAPLPATPSLEGSSKVVHKNMDFTSRSSASDSVSHSLHNLGEITWPLWVSFSTQGDIESLWR